MPRPVSRPPSPHSGAAERHVAAPALPAVRATRRHPGGHTTASRGPHGGIPGRTPTLRSCPTPDAWATTGCVQPGDPPSPRVFSSRSGRTPRPQTPGPRERLYPLSRGGSGRTVGAERAPPLELPNVKRVAPLRASPVPTLWNGGLILTARGHLPASPPCLRPSSCLAVRPALGAGLCELLGREMGFGDHGAVSPSRRAWYPLILKFVGNLGQVSHSLFHWEFDTNEDFSSSLPQLSPPRIFLPWRVPHSGVYNHSENGFKITPLF